MEKSKNGIIMNALEINVKTNNCENLLIGKNNEKLTNRRTTADEKAISNLKFRIPDIDNIFDIHGRIGNGTFSTVLLASLKCQSNIPRENRKLFAIKHLIPTSHPKRIQKELKCLAEIGGVDNVAGIDLCLRRNESVAFVMPYIAHDRFHDYFDKMDTLEIQRYLKNLLIALKRVHSFNIIHRDVKPSNFLYNRKSGNFMLVDFGLAESVHKVNDDELNIQSSGNMLTTTSKVLATSIETEKETEGIKSEIVAVGDQKIENKNLMNHNRKRKASDSITDDHHYNHYESNYNNSTKRMKESIENQQGNNNNSNRVYKNLPSQNSPFKMPLKQLNEILAPKSLTTINNLSTNNCGNKLNSPLLHNVKSAILSATLTPRLEEKFRIRSSLNCRRQINNNPSVQQKSTKLSLLSSSHKCYCYGKNQVCNMCIVKKEIPASRAGTPGYRPPEVLLKYVEQTTAVDIWAVGVILISILSSVNPFFQAPDDFLALAEIVTIFGDDVIRRTAFTLGRQITMSRKCKPLDLRKLCIRLRNRFKLDRTEAVKKYQQNNSGMVGNNGSNSNNIEKCPECSNCQQQLFDCLCANSQYTTEPIGEDIFPTSVYNLLERLLEVNPHKRITADEALNHPFFKEIY